MVGQSCAQAHIAFVGAMYVLRIAAHDIGRRSGEEWPLALGMVDTEVDQFMKPHAIAIQ